jgi:PAS domain S-box-containing protein
VQTLRALPRARADRLALRFAITSFLAVVGIGAVIHLVLVQGASGAERVRIDEVLASGLIALYVLLLPLALRAGRTLRDQTARLEGQTRQLSALLDQMPAAIWSTDERLRFTGGHGSALAGLGLVPARMAGSTPQELFQKGPGGAAAIDAHRRALRGETVAFEVEVGQRAFQACVQPLRSGARVIGAVGAAFDVTDRKRAERSLDRLEQQHALILEAAGEGVVGVGVRGNATFVNPAAARMLGWKPQELLGRNVHAVFHHSHEDGAHYDNESCPATLVLRDGRVRESDDDWFWRRDGSAFPVEFVAAPLRQAGRVIGAVLVFRDVTQRRHDEEELRQNFRLLRKSHEQRRRLVQQLVHAEEEERKRIAGDIHDDSLQHMAAVSMYLYSLRRHLHGSAEERALAVLEDSVREAIGRLRQLLFELRPMTLDGEGLGASLRILLQQTLETDGVVCAVQDRLSGEPPPDARTVLYRIAREALANVRKHAGASRVDVVLLEEGGGYRVLISDDGRGFSSDALEPQPGHLGVSAMRERAEVTGGWFRIEGEPGRGSSVEFWVPGDQVSGAAAAP